MIKILQNIAVVFAVFFLGSSSASSQAIISGNITDEIGMPLSGANVFIKELNTGTQSDASGAYEINLEEVGLYNITISYLGMKSVIRELEISSSPYILDIQMTPDPLELGSVIVTGSFNENSRLATSTASSTLSERDMKNSGALGTAELLSNVTGTFVDASAGSIFTKVYSRGISSSAEEDIGWYYMSLQEDGLPVTNYHTTFYGPDMFHRVDLTTRRLEAVRGGSAMITSTNSPGGIFNFISKTGGNRFGAEMLVTGGLQGDNNMMARYDVNVGGSISDNGLSYNIGGFYRYDQGARNTDINWENGGQFKANISKRTKNGFFKVYGKYLNDKVNRYQGIAARNWSDPEPAFGFDFNSSAIILPKMSANISDGRLAADNQNATYEFDTNNGIKTKDLALGFQSSHDFSGWNLNSNIKVSDKKSDWNSTLGNQPLGLETFLPYLLNGVDPTFQNVPLGNIVFRDANSNEVLAKVNNFGILNVFQGLPPSFEYTEGSLPNDALLGIAPWKKTDEAKELMGEITLTKQFGNHSLTSGVYYAHSDIESFTSASYAYATYEDRPRALYVTLENEGSPVIELSDKSGFSNYGGLLYNRGSAKINQLAFFLNDNIQFGDKLNLDLGARYDRVSHNGDKDRSSPNFAPGGLDGDETTAYDNSTLLATQKDLFDFKYNYLSWSLGINYLITDDIAAFARASNGHKAPEMNYYFNNFSGLPIDKAGTEQDIFQGELGIKIVSPKFSLFTTAFYSQLDNIAFSEFVLDQQDGSIFFTPIQLNKTTTIGLEIEGNVTLTSKFDLNFKATLQDAEATRFTIYDANDSVDTDDDSISDFSGKDLPHNPNVMLEISPRYSVNKLNVFATWRFMGKRKGNVSNAFELPAFSTINAGIGYQLNQSINITLIANNLLNSKGLMNFFGPNEFGSNSNAANEDYINANPDATFMVFPINPRSLFLKVGYTL